MYVFSIILILELHPIARIKTEENTCNFQSQKTQSV